ncbi:MAG TPA: ABC transporter permease [Thermoleophilaceae bacterium]|nr:ABC transporter permease [Thermoleophilaceae bacterium]
MALAWEQFRFERKQFWRNPSAAFFNLALPLMFLLLVGAVFADGDNELNVLVPGIAGMSVMANTFNALAFAITFQREQGILKRVRGTPMPIASYLGGLVGSAVANALAQVLVVVAVGHLLFGVDWPHDWALLAGFTLLGVVCFAALGIAFAHVIPNQDSAPAYENAVFLPLIFISGVFYSADSLPPALAAVAEVLPLKHLIDGLSAAITGAEVNLAAAAAVVGAWALLGVFCALRFFRWEAAG